MLQRVKGFRLPLTCKISCDVCCMLFVSTASQSIIFKHNFDGCQFVLFPPPTSPSLPIFWRISPFWKSNRKQHSTFKKFQCTEWNIKSSSHFFHPFHSLQLGIVQPFSDSFNFLVVLLFVRERVCVDTTDGIIWNVRVKGFNWAGSKLSWMRMEQTYKYSYTHSHSQYMNKIKELTKSQVFIYNVLPYIPFIVFIGYRQLLYRRLLPPTSTAARILYRYCFLFFKYLFLFWFCYWAILLLLVVKMSAFALANVCRFQSNFMQTHALTPSSAREKVKIRKRHCGKKCSVSIW